MAINGLLTDIGLTKSQIALNNQGWYIFPTRFEVAETAGTFDKTRVGGRDWVASTPYAVGDLVVPTTPNGFYYICSSAGTSDTGEPSWPTSAGSVADGGVIWDFVGASSGGLETIWFAAAITTRIEGPPNTIEIVLTIPPGADPSDRDINEIYIFAEDSLGAEFLLAVGQPSATITYDKDGSTSLRLAITLTNVNISGLFVFKYTQATEISEHSVDPNAHPDIRDLLRLQFNLATNGGMAIDRNPSGFDLSDKTFGFGPAEWEGQLTATGAVSGTLVRKEDSIIEGSRSMHFSSISLAGGGEELHVRKRIRSDTARLLSNDPWVASTDYVVGDVVVPTSSPLLRFRCTVAGTANSTEPSWPSLAGDTIVDGGVTWEAILGNFSLSWRAFQDTGATQFAIITLRTPNALDDFGGASTTLLTTGATDHPMLDGVVTTVERAAITLPDVNNGLEIEIQVDTGALTTKNFEFSRFKFEPTEVVTPFVGYPFGIENIISQGYLEDAFAYEVIIGLQADVDKGLATITINELDALATAGGLANGDRILILEGTHTLTGSIALSESQLVIQAISPAAIIDLASTYTFTLSGTDCLLDCPFTGMTADSLIISGNGSRFLGTDELLANIDVSGNSWAITGDGIEFAGFLLQGIGDVVFNSLKLTSLGTELLPALSITGDPDTGIWSPGPDQYSISAGASEKLRAAAGGVSVYNGVLALDRVGDAADADLLIDRDDGQFGVVAYRTGASLRWEAGVENTPESAGDVGSDYVIRRFDNSGVLIDTPFSIDRATGEVTISALIATHASTHIRAGVDEIDGDKLDIDWNPTYYAPATTPSEVTNIDELTAHLYGIDRELGGVGYDIRVGSSGEVTSGVATHTAGTFVAAITNYSRVLILSGTQTLIRDETITETGVVIHAQHRSTTVAILALGAFWIDFSGDECQVNAKISGAETGDFRVSGDYHEMILWFASSDADALDDSGVDNIINFHVV